MSVRAAFERVFAGVILCASAALVVGGTIAICLPGSAVVVG